MALSSARERQRFEERTERAFRVTLQLIRETFKTLQPFQHRHLPRVDEDVIDDEASQDGGNVSASRGHGNLTIEVRTVQGGDILESARCHRLTVLVECI